MVMRDKFRTIVDKLEMWLTPLTKDGQVDNHFLISFCKSAVRIIAGFLLMCAGNVWLVFAGFLFIFAELLGIAEEIA